MSSPSRYAVPLDSLDGVRVGVEEQVQAHDSRVFGEAVAPGVPDGGAGVCDGDGD